MFVFLHDSVAFTARNYPHRLVIVKAKANYDPYSMQLEIIKDGRLNRSDLLTTVLNSGMFAGEGGFKARA